MEKLRANGRRFEFSIGNEYLKHGMGSFQLIGKGQRKICKIQYSDVLWQYDCMIYDRISL